MSSSGRSKPESKTCCGNPCCDVMLQADMVRVSPPELAREFPGPQASIRVTFTRLCASWSADQPPNAPAPTTITEV